MKKILTLFLFVMGTSIIMMAQSSPDATGTPNSSTSTTDKYHDTGASMTTEESTTQPAASVTVLDSIAPAPAKESRFSGDLTLASINYNRGARYGNSPSIQAKLNYNVCSYFAFGAYGSTTLNGEQGYGNQLNVYATFKHKDFTLTFDDLYFTDMGDDWSTYDKDKTGHYIEARAKYDTRLDFTAAYTIYQNSSYGSNKAVYFELGYDVTKEFNMFAGYITDESAQNFYDDGGMTAIGGTYSKPLNIKNIASPMLKTTLAFNPNHNNVSELPGIGSNEVYLIVSLTF